MYLLHSEMLARSGSAEHSRASNQRASRRSSLRIILESRRAREKSLAR